MKNFVQVRLPAKLHAGLKILAIKKGSDLTTETEAAVNEYLERQDKEFAANS